MYEYGIINKGQVYGCVFETDFTHTAAGILFFLLFFLTIFIGFSFYLTLFKICLII